MMKASPQRIAAVAALASFSTLALATTQDKPAIPLSAASTAFHQRGSMCRHDHGKLWGRSLCGPMMLVDPATHQAVLNEPSPGTLKEGSLYLITLPKTMGLGNTAVDYAGKRWSMLLWPLPHDNTARAIMLMHESYHRIQPALGLAPSGRIGANAHLDTEAGRIWLRAELHALRAALEAHGQVRRRAIADALRFRIHRRSLWPHAAAEEDALELNEGMAESTGIDVALATPSARVAAAIDDIDGHEKDPSYVRAFAYATGPAYAELLDAVAPGWRHDVNPDFDFGKTTARAYHIAMPSPDARLAHAALAHYGGKQIVAEETQRAQRVTARNQRYTAEFLHGSTLTLPLKHMQISFDPRAVESFAGHGSVYHVLTVSDDWGTLQVKSGDALINAAFNKVSIPVGAPLHGSALAGNGWSVQLKPGYKPTPDKDKKNSWNVTARDVTTTQAPAS